MKKIYADYAATTPLDPIVLECMNPYFTKFYGNASSIHTFGIKSKQALEKARKVVLKSINAEPKELLFTGSATEANNLVLKGFAFNKFTSFQHIESIFLDFFTVNFH